MAFKPLSGNYTKKLNLIVFIAFSFLIKHSTSLKIPMNTKEITFQEYNGINSYKNNIRSLVQKDLEITNYKYLLMETEVCIGTPLQCFKVLYDTGSTYLIVGMASKNLKFKKGFKTVISDTYMASNCENIIPFAYKSAVIMAHEARDKVTIIENYRLAYLFSFLLAFNSTENIEYEGILGLGNYYPDINEENSFDARFSFVHYLKMNGIINKLIFGHEYIDRTHGNIYFGEEPKSMRNGYFRCKSDHFISYMNKWHCQILSMYFSNGENYTVLGSTAAFDTGYTYIKGPLHQVEIILNKIKEIGGDKCESIYQLIDDKNQLMRIVCDMDIDKSLFPDISFDIVGFKMTLLKSDLFRKIILKGGEKKYEVIILGDTTYDFWNFGEPILKNYDMVFNYEDNTVGLKFNENYLGGDWTNVIILAVILIFFSCVAWYLIRNRKNLFKKTFKEEDIEKLKNASELQEGLSFNNE